MIFRNYSLERLITSRKFFLNQNSISGVTEFTKDGRSKVLLSNPTQPYIVSVDGETGEIEGPVYQHPTQRATGMCIDKSAMELYFIDVSTRPAKIQV